jgi:hypothetical protein
MGLVEESMDVKSDYQRSTRFKFKLKRNSDRRAPIRVLGFVAVLAIMLAMLAPIAPLAQSAAAADDQTEEIAEETVQEDPYTGGIYLTKYVCDEDYGGDPYQLYENCEVSYDFEFGVFGPEYEEYFQGSISKSGLPAGGYGIQESIPEGYGTPIAFCGIGPSDGGTPQYGQVEVYDGYYEFHLDYNQSIYCDWFNIKNAEEHHEDEYGSLVIYKFFCPQESEYDFYSADSDSLREYCEQYGGGEVGFDLYSSETGETQGRYTVEGEGAAVWEEVPGGHTEVTEYAIEGYGTPAIFCAVFVGEEYEWLQVDVHDWTAGFEFPYGKDVVCFWFNIPEYDEYGDIYIVKYFCEYEHDFDAYGAEYQYLLEYCEHYTGDEVGFELYHHDLDETFVQYTGQGEGSVAYWENVPGGDLTITEYAQEGYGTPVVYCAVLADWDEEPYFEPYLVEGTSISGYLEHGYNLACFWFNIPEYDDYGTITIYKYFCPQEYEGDYYDAEFEYLQEYCEAYYGEDVAFDLYHHDLDETYTESTGQGEGGAAYWDEVPSGDLTITEQGWEGYDEPIYYCAVYYGDEQVDLIRYDVSDASISGYLESGYHLVCYVFNIPEHHDNGTVTIYKYFCPEEYEFDYYGAELEYLQEYCEGYEGDDVEFELYHDGTGESVTRSTEDGVAYWDDVPGGDLTITEYGWDGYGEPLVYCDVYYPWDEQEPLYERYEVDGTAISGYLEQGYHLVCLWFNIPEYEDDGYVVVKKWVCPEGYDYYELSLDELYEYCDEVFAHVDFHLVYGEEDDEEETDSNGEATWDELAPGYYGLYEEIPDGYGEPIFYCWPSVVTGDEGYATSPERYDLIDGYGIEFELEYGMTWYCDVFNIPYEDDNTVYVKKWVCPEGYDVYDLTYEELKELCHEVFEGVDFYLTDGEDAEKRTTDNDGETAWTGLGTGEFGLYEDVPDGFSQPIVFCGWSNEYEGEYQDPEWWKLYSFDGNPGITWSFEGYGHYLFCDVFNVPYEDEDGSITIYKWLCPAGYDLYDEYSDPWEDCTKAYEGVTFEIDGPDGYDDSQKTGDYIPGGVYWDELEAGDYEITEKLPNGIAYGFVLACEGGYFPQIYPLYTTESGKPFELYLEYGQHIACDWFNVPYEDQHKDDKGTLTVIKYWCEGDYVSDYNCALYSGGQAFVLSAASGEGDPIEFVTGANGKKTLTLGDGEWSLDEVGREWCLAESPDVNADGYIETYEGHDSVVSVYNCGDTPPGGGKQPPTKMPNTGSGAAADSLSGLTIAGMTGGTETLGLLIVAGHLVGLAGLALHRARRNRIGSETEVRPAA